MQPVWELIRAWFDTGASLLLGGVFAITAVTGYLKEKHFNFAEAAVRLSAGAALIAVGVLYLLDLVFREWLLVNFCMVWGILCIMEGTGILSVAITAGVRKWLAVVAGVVMMSWAVFFGLAALGAFRH